MGLEEGRVVKREVTWGGINYGMKKDKRKIPKFQNRRLDECIRGALDRSNWLKNYLCIAHNLISSNK